MAELKGFARFRKTKSPEPKFFDINIGSITVDTKVHAALEAVKKKFGDASKFGKEAIKTDGQAAVVLLEQLVYFKKGKRRGKKSSKAGEKKA